MSSRNPKTVLFMTVSETGQSNSIFALSLELLTHPNVDVHVASFPILRKRAEELSSSAKVVQRKHPDSSFTFHDIDGMSLGEAVESKGLTGASFPHPPIARSHDEGINKLIIMLTGWNGKGTTHHFRFFPPPMRFEYRSLTEMAAVVLRIRQSGRQLQRHHQRG